MLFWDVDTQVDFLSPTGRLYVPESEKLIPNLRQLTEWAASHNVTVISSADAHLAGDPELQIYGPHCMLGTPGQQKVPETLLDDRYIIPNRAIELPDLHRFQQIILEKQAFDFATNPNSGKVLQQFAAEADVVLYGVVTEICVSAAAQALFAAGRKLFLVRDAIAELDHAKGEAFCAEFVSRGGKVVTTREVTSSPNPRLN
ncbi:MAG TPA: cysteine hydrolase family protein [Candidatus Sulfotelmatobacter sp.]|nr:cysteine hydrolase family protein [Candidatus Sulfotelmatobacter sp.]